MAGMKRSGAGGDALAATGSTHPSVEAQIPVCSLRATSLDMANLCTLKGDVFRLLRWHRTVCHRTRGRANRIEALRVAQQEGAGVETACVQP